MTRCLLLTAAFLLTSATAASAVPKKPVIFDTDVCDDIDDTWALALLLQCPELDCKLVTTAVGNTKAKAQVVAKYLDKVDRTEIPVGIGVKQHDKQHRQTPWAADYDLSSYPGKIHEDGVQTMIEMIMNSPERITVIAVGPLPNIGEALKREPRIAQKADFIGMHGSIYKGYGGRSEPSPEYNVRADVPACRAAFTAPWDVVITPLDTCGLVHLRGEKYQKVLKRNSAITSNLIQNYRVWHKSGLRNQNKNMAEAELDRRVDEKIYSSSTTLFDTVAIYLAISHDLVEMKKLPVQVTDKGHTKVVEGAKMIRCAVDWKDLGAYEDWLVDRLTK
jgi:inosine-uridine nucleoside N-ribohydrolase